MSTHTKVMNEETIWESLCEIEGFAQMVGEEGIEQSNRDLFEAGKRLHNAAEEILAILETMGIDVE